MGTDHVRALQGVFVTHGFEIGATPGLGFEPRIP